MGGQQKSVAAHGPSWASQDENLGALAIHVRALSAHSFASSCTKTSWHGRDPCKSSVPFQRTAEFGDPSCTLKLSWLSWRSKRSCVVAFMLHAYCDYLTPCTLVPLKYNACPLSGRCREVEVRLSPRGASPPLPGARWALLGPTSPPSAGPGTWAEPAWDGFAAP